jgi:hypothetical protein
MAVSDKRALERLVIATCALRLAQTAIWRSNLQFAFCNLHFAMGRV